MKTLVISDIHHKHVRAQAIIDSVEHDTVVLLGDYFDAYGDTVENVRETAIWLKEHVLYNPKIVPLIGNHDINYIWPDNPYFRCSGYSSIKSVAINDILNSADKARLKFIHFEQGFVFSHAGVSNQIWKKLLLRHTENTNKPKLEFFREVLETTVEESIIELNRGNPAELFGIGWDRNGHQPDGGIIWVDWSNLSPISGINQIVGHSHRTIPEIRTQRVGGALSRKNIVEYYEDIQFLAYANSVIQNPIKREPLLSVSYNLDTGLNHYGVVEDGVLEIYDYFHRINVKDISKYAIPSSPLNNLS